CSVVVKGHPGHSETSRLVAGAIMKAIEKCQMPNSVFQHVDAPGFGPESFDIGKKLVQHPATAAVGFTGSLSGGKALYEYSHARSIPIPVFAEMGSINPVVFFPDTLSKNADSLAKMYSGSITVGMGQFCTNPGLMIAIESEFLNTFLQKLGDEVSSFQPAKMLHEGIQKDYAEKLKKALTQKGVDLVTVSKDKSNGSDADASIASVSAETFLKNPFLREEIFGPYSLMVKCKSADELQKVWLSLSGQLTTSVMGTDEDLMKHKEIINSAQQLAGRIIFNQAPTGVEVCASMIHGGPFPATTDSRFTSVGTTAAKRWVRPICFQNCPEFLLPVELKNANPKKIWRTINDRMENGDVG
ncbi:MAG: aldehyde dehydrogenase family protein, partial [Ginsengibacter sp.]